LGIKSDITKLHYSSGGTNSILKVLLKSCSFFYGIGSGFKNYMYDNGIVKPFKVPATVISVGNLTTGGVGKTPVVAEIAKYLSSNGEKVAIVSRGYGGKLSNKQINLISDGEKVYYNARLAGDEPYWLANNTNAVVVTSKNRVRASKFAIKNFNVSYIILDDGFQHRKLHRDIDIILIDSEKRLGNGNQLPLGPLRESQESISRADRIVIVSKNYNHESAQDLVEKTEKKFNIKTFLCKTEPDEIYNIETGNLLQNSKEVVAMTAIGQPEQFFGFLKNYDIVEKVIFDDHHKYMVSDIPKTKLPIVTTEKDAVKLKGLGIENIYALKLRTNIDVGRLLDK